jgi:hypothetical protein
MRPSLPPGAPHRTPRINTELQNESLYGYWTSYGISNYLESLGSCSPLSKKLMEYPVISEQSVHPINVKEIADGLGLTTEQVCHLQGQDIGDGRDYSVLHRALRYCPQCLDLGYHSIVFQHVGISRCPLHNCMLQDCCPVCDELIYPTFRSCLDNPFECLRCFAPLTRTVASSTDPRDAKAADLIMGNRRVVLSKSHNSASHRHMFSVLKPRMLKPSTPAVSRLYQRVAVWAEPFDCQWPNFKEDILMIVPAHTRGDVDAADSFNTGLAAERVLIFLTQLCRGHEVQAIRLANRLGRWPLGLRLNSQATVIAAALYKLAVAYDLVQEASTIFELQLSSMTEKGRACYGKQMVRYGDSEPAVPELDYRLMQLEMLGMFAWLVIWYRDHAPLSSVSWIDLPHAIEFAPSWHITHSPSGSRVRIRSRATEKSIRRLVQRYWKSDLTYVSEDPVGADELWRFNRLDRPMPERYRSSDIYMNPVQRRLLDMAWPRKDMLKPKKG